MELNNILIAFGLTIFAGLSTGIGSILAFFTKRTNTKFLAIALGFSAGVMIYISMTEMLVEANHSLVKDLGKHLGSWISMLSFFAGIVFIAIIDKIIPSNENPHEMHMVEEIDNPKSGSNTKKLFRTGVFTALAITIHNFPEGLATITASIKDLSIGIPIAVAIAIHNIPEGIAISMPIYYATCDKKKAFKYSFLSGLAEPLGAIVGYLLLLPFYNNTIAGILFAFVAGIMVFISLDELLPSAREYGEHHLSIYGLICGMFVMAVSLLMFI